VLFRSRVSVNPVSGWTTVAYDPGKTSLSTIRAAIEDCGFHCAGEAVPKHLCYDLAMPRRPLPAKLFAKEVLRVVKKWGPAKAPTALAAE
jgi:hypothetical protein